MDETRDLKHEEQADKDDAPVGAVVITSILAIVILVLWFGIYILNIARS
jgi:Cytochrome c oxidase subunit IIa family